MVEIHDYRFVRTASSSGVTPRPSISGPAGLAPALALASIWRVLLQPSQSCMIADMERIRSRSVEPLSDAALLEIESRALVR
jgi:hypothetical protein